MSASTRSFGWSVGVASVLIGAPNDYTAIFTDCKLSLDFDVDHSRAIADTGDATIKSFLYDVQKARGWSVELGAIVDSANSSKHLIKLAIAQASLAINIWRPGSGVASGAAGYTYSGTGIITEANIEFPDGAAMQGATVLGVGALVATGT